MFFSEPTDSTVVIGRAELDSVLNKFIDLRARYLSLKASSAFERDSLQVMCRVKDIEIEVLKDERGGLLDDPRVWFMLGAGLALLAN